MNGNGNVPTEVMSKIYVDFRLPGQFSSCCGIFLDGVQAPTPTCSEGGYFGDLKSKRTTGLQTSGQTDKSQRCSRIESKIPVTSIL